MLTKSFLEGLATYAEEHKEDLTGNEESTKHSLVLPVFQAWGYNIFHKREVDPEFVCDVGVKKGERVDYAIKHDGEPTILVEAKSIEKKLDVHLTQLYRYFSATPARFGVLTNGVEYQFFTDREVENMMDTTPFFEMDIRSADDYSLVQLRQFAKDNFNVDKIKDGAVEAEIIRAVKAQFAAMYDNPDYEFSKVMLQDAVQDRRLTRNLVSQYGRLVKRSFYEFVRDHSGDKPANTPAAIPEIVPPAAIPEPSAPRSSFPKEDWQVLTTMTPEPGDSRPDGVRFPDGSEVKTQKSWSRITEAITRYLVLGGHLTEDHIPIQRGNRYIVAKEPVHPNGTDFYRAYPVVSFYIEGNYSAPVCVENAQTLITTAGLDPSQFQIHW